MKESLPHPQLLLSLSALRDRAMAAKSLNQLAFSMANDLYPLLQFRQALVFAANPTGLQLLSVSGLAKPTEESPYLLWLHQSAKWLTSQLTDNNPAWITRDATEPPSVIADGWTEWWSDGVWCVPITDPEGKRLGMLLFLLDTPPLAQLPPLLCGLWQTWGYCWAALAGHSRLPTWRPGKRAVLITAAITAILLLLPVSQTSLAPAEIVSSEAVIISSPIDGVIKEVLVRPNQPVEAGTALFTLDETTLRSRAEVLRKEVYVAEAELLSASQRAFDNAQSKNDLTLLNGRAQQRRAELASIEVQLQRTRVVAPRTGVAVFSDPNDWLGKPVATGERIMLVADPARPAMQIQLPVADAIALEVGAQVTLYLSAYPLQPLHGRILETSYQARPTDDSVIAYRLLASIEDKPEHARLGLHGTAKLYGDKVLLGYYLIRRPLAALRAWTGL